MKIKIPPQIFLSKIEHRGQPRIQILFDKDHTLISKIKSIEGRKWSQTKRCWHLPYSTDSLQQLKIVFGEENLILPKKKIGLQTQQKVNFVEYYLGNEKRLKVVGEKIIIQEKNQHWLNVYVPSDKKGWVKIIKSINGRKWNIEKICWEIPYVKDNFKLLWKQIGKKKIELNFKIKKNIPNKSNYTKTSKRDWQKTNSQKFKLNEFQKNAIIKFEEKLILENKAWRTRKTYKGLFTSFILFYPNTKPSKITKEQIEQYIIFKKQDYISDSQLNQLINCFNCFFCRLLNQEEKVIKLERPKRKKKLPNVFSLEEVEKLLKSISNIKHKCMLILTYSAGLRKSEVLDLKMSDINFDRKTIFIKDSKGGKDRYTFLADLANKHIQLYLTQYQPSYYLFEGQFGGRYGESSIQKIFNDAKVGAQISSNVTLHGLRHSFATHLVEKGVPLHVVQDLLGHSSIKTTEIYLHISSKFRKELRSPLDDLNI